MKNKTTSYKWAYLPFVFSSATILATQATAGPAGSQQYQDAKQVNSVNHEYVGGKTQLGVGVNDDGDVDVEFNHVISESENHSTGVGLWAGYDLKGDDTGILGRGGEINHAWVSRDGSGRARHVNKVFGAYDRNETGHDKATVGYGRENQDLFWDAHVSKGLSGRKDTRTVNGVKVSDRAYDYGVGGTVGKFLPDSNVRIRAGLDHEWSDKVGKNEKDARNTTLSGGIEKFFQDTGHSLSLDVAASNSSGGFRYDGIDDTDVSGRLGYRYDFGGASIYQPDRRYKRVRVEVPGKTVPYKQLVKSTMELEGQTFFKLNSAKLIPSAQTRLKQIAAQIRKSGYKGSIRITGNTCGLGDPVYDQRLSERRAKAVRNFLIKNGFNADHLIARGLGKGHPKYPRTPDQDFKNRRVDIEYVSEQKTYKTGYKTGQTGVIWKTESIPTLPAWIKRALHNNIKHDRNVNTFTTTEGFDQPVNSDPIAVDDSATTMQGVPVTLATLSNDSDPEGDTLTITSVGMPSNGTAVISGGEIIYTPNPGFTGVDTFSYTISDGNGGTATATETVTVTAKPNLPPIAIDDTASTGCSAITIDVLKNDSDPDGDALSIIDVGSASLGTAVISGNTIVYTPSNTCSKGNTGTDTFSYTISDGNGNTASANVSVDVKGVKDGGGIDAEPDDVMVHPGETVSINVLANDAGTGLKIEAVDEPSQGTAKIVGSTIVYTANDDAIGSDHFWYGIVDVNGDTDSALVQVLIIEKCEAVKKCN